MKNTYIKPSVQVVRLPDNIMQFQSDIKYGRFISEKEEMEDFQWDEDGGQ